MTEFGGSGSGASAKALQMATIPMTELADTEFIPFRVHVPDGKTFRLESGGLMNDANNRPQGLDGQVYRHDNNGVAHTINSKREVGDPLVSISGPVDLSLRIKNDTGSTQNASATFGYKIE